MYASAKLAQRPWARTPLWKRAEILKKAASLMRENAPPMATCLIKEVAKPAKDSLSGKSWKGCTLQLGSVRLPCSASLCHPPDCRGSCNCIFQLTWQKKSPALRLFWMRCHACAGKRLAEGR